MIVYTYISQTYSHLLAHIADPNVISIRASQPNPVPPDKNNCEHNIEDGDNMNKKTPGICHGSYEVLSK